MTILTRENINFIQGLINAKEPGRYTVAVILGVFWEGMGSPSDFGKEFKQAVNCGLLSGIRFHSKLSNNSALYAIRQ